MQNKKIYSVNDALFIYKKSATNEKKANGGEIVETEIAEKVFREKFYDFSDGANFEKNNPNFFKDEEPEFNSATEDLPSMPGAEFVPEPSAELSALAEMVKDLQSELAEMKTANENLKTGRVKLSYEDAQELYIKKSQLIKSIRTYTTVKDEFLKIELLDDEENLLNAKGFNMAFNANEGYRDEAILKTSSMLVISEFVPFIIEKLNNKIEDLKQEVETIDFV